MLTLATNSSVEFNPSSARRTARRCSGRIGGFGGLFAPNFRGMREPVLVASVDGVGTKLKDRLRREQARHRRCRSGESLRQRHRRPRRAAAFFSRLHRRGKIGVAGFLGIAARIQQGLSRGQLCADRRRDGADAGNVSPRRIRSGGLHRRRGRSRPRSSMAARSEPAMWFSGCRRTDCIPMDIRSRGKSCSKD